VITARRKKKKPTMVESNVGISIANITREDRSQQLHIITISRPISDLPRNNKNKIADLFFLVRFF
jgi:hypothetical protein